MTTRTCRFCKHVISHTFVNLGMTPLANSYLKKAELNKKETFYPLHVFVCEQCFLVQLEEFESPEKIFSDYAYFSSYSQTWLDHAEQYANKMITQYNISDNSLVVEIASNDGYLLKNFKKQSINVLGIEPAANVAEVAISKGIPTRISFFGEVLAKELIQEGMKADLLIGNNVLAHVPNLCDFIYGIKLILNNSGIVTLEFPHLVKLFNENQFDTIYHEHFSYFSLTTISIILKRYQLVVFDVELLNTHGGSLRIYIKHEDDFSKTISSNVKILQEYEDNIGISQIETYFNFQQKVMETKRTLLSFLIGEKRKGKRIVGYGAPAKGNTLLNYCGIKEDFIDYTVDKNPHKQGLYLPGTHIEIKSPEEIFNTKPDYLLILPWNIKNEIMQQTSFIREWGGKYIVPIPTLEVL